MKHFQGGDPVLKIHVVADGSAMASLMELVEREEKVRKKEAFDGNVPLQTYGWTNGSPNK